MPVRPRDAIQAFQAVLSVDPNEHSWIDWTRLKYNLGLTLLTSGKLESNRALAEEAVPLLRMALEETPREQLPNRWSQIQERGSSDRVQPAGDQQTPDDAHALRADLARSEQPVLLPERNRT